MKIICDCGNEVYTSEGGSSEKFEIDIEVGAGDDTKIASGKNQKSVKLLIAGEPNQDYFASEEFIFAAECSCGLKLIRVMSAYGAKKAA